MNAKLELLRGISTKLSDSPEIAKYFSKENRPYATSEEVLLELPKGLRHLGLTVNIVGTEYWFKEGKEDINLVIKEPNTTNLVRLSENREVNLTGKVSVRSALTNSEAVNLGQVKSLIPKDASKTVTGLVNNTELQELGGVDKLINGVRIGRGTGNNALNLVIGTNSPNNTSGESNVFIGPLAGTSNETGYANVYLGESAGNANKISNHLTALGANTLMYYTGIGTGGSTAVGSSAQEKNRTGKDCMAIGTGALQNNLEGNNNTGGGEGSLQEVTSSDNTSFGAFSGHKQILGARNINFGSMAGGRNVEGSRNIQLGNGTITSGLDGGNDNIFITEDLITGIVSGSGNVVIGKVKSLNAALNNTIHLANGVGTLALRMNTDKSMDLPELTIALINSGTNKSAVTKEWVKDASGKEDLINKQNNLNVDATNKKYPTVTATNLGLYPKLESVVNTTYTIRKVWHGEFSQFKALYLAGSLDGEVEYNYDVPNQVTKDPASIVSYILTKFDHKVTQIIKTSCNLSLPTDVKEFEVDIIVAATGINFNMYGGPNLRRIHADGTITSGDQINLPPGKYTLIQEGITLNYILV